MAEAVSAYSSAMVLLQQGRFEPGAEALRSIVDGGGLPSHMLPDAFANLGTALSALSRHEEAIGALSDAVASRPSNGHFRYNLALSLADRGRAAEAETHYRASIRLSPGPSAAGAYNNLGNLLVRAGRRTEALGCFRGAVASDPAHAMSHNNLANLLRDKADDEALRAAGQSYAKAVRLAPRYLEAYKNLGNLMKERAEWRQGAVRAYRIALSLMPLPYATAGREIISNLGETLQWLGRAAAANASFALGVARGVYAHAQQRPSHYARGLHAAPWWRADDASPRILKALLRPKALATLREEGLALLRRGGDVVGRGGDVGRGRDGFLPYFSAALTSGEWRDVTLALSGTRQPGAAHAPGSYELYESLGEQATTMVMGSAYFSVLTPGARLRPHCGPTNIRLRVHVGLSVSPGAAIRVGNETRPWEEGSALIFDDSFEHEVWNDSTEPRLVFIFDIWHPQLATDDQRMAALDDLGRQRYSRAMRSLHSGRGLPEAEDLIAERRVRTIF